MITLHNKDCMEAMRDFPDGFFDLAIVDPPYGIGGEKGFKTSKKVLWDDTKTPSKEYFKQLVRVSKNQIIWGGNYMSTKIPFNSTHTIVWDKENGKSFMSDGEIAFTSFLKNSTRFIRIFWMSNMMKSNEKPIIHPTQKPIQLYEILLKTYAKKGDKILDTHLGSASSAIAVFKLQKELQLSFWGYELNKEYFLNAKNRFENHKRQIRMF